MGTFVLQRAAMEVYHRTRKPLEEIIFGCRWGQVSPLVGNHAEGKAEDDT